MVSTRVLIHRSEKYKYTFVHLSTCQMKYYKIEPVLPCVDVEVGEDECVEGTLLCRPLHHRLEPVLQEQDCKSFAKTFFKPSCICCDSHPWEGPHCPVQSGLVR